MAESMTVEKLKLAHPFPWREMTHPTGIVHIIDAAGKEVPLFTMTGFICFITNHLAQEKK
jgi:hypothetical protein